MTISLLRKSNPGRGSALVELTISMTLLGLLFLGLSRFGQTLSDTGIAIEAVHYGVRFGLRELNPEADKKAGTVQFNSCQQALKLTPGDVLEHVAFHSCEYLRKLKQDTQQWTIQVVPWSPFALDSGLALSEARVSLLSKTGVNGLRPHAELKFFY